MREPVQGGHSPDPLQGSSLGCGAGWFCWGPRAVSRVCPQSPSRAPAVVRMCTEAEAGEGLAS